MVASASQSQSQLLSAEEEAIKRNADCVYFLASPLTCKKGGECEYRHSDVARVNPRDCWYWLHGNCLNPKCAFRHPPLDGFFGAQTPTSTALYVPVAQTVAASASHSPNPPTKQQGVLCVFFQKGYCLKGDWCQFLHTPIPPNTKPLPVTGAAFSAEAVNVKKPVAVACEKSVQQNVQENVLPITAAEPPVPREFAPPRNQFSMNKRAPQTLGITEFSGYSSVPHVSNGNNGYSSVPHMSNGNNGYSNNVNWDCRPHLLEDPESTTSKDAEEVSREPSPGFDVLVDDDGRVSDFYAGEERYGIPREHDAEYGIDHPTDDYPMIAAVDDEGYHNRFMGQFAWEHHKASSYRERTPYNRLDIVGGQVDESDLRHHLVKHHKPNGLRSVISREHSRDMQVGDRSYQSSRRDFENSIGSRLRGRIGFPQRSLSPNNRDVIRSTDRGRSRILSIQERIKGVDEGFNDGVKKYRVPRSRRDIGYDNNAADFAAPKSLAELKNRKNAEQQSLGKRKHLTADLHQESVNFEGPKPLEEILKRKKRETVFRNTSNKEDTVEDKHQEKIVMAEVTKTDEKPKSEDGILGEYGVEQEYEHGEGYELYDGENGDGVGQYVEEERGGGEYDDDDDFAKKMGVAYT